MDDTGKVLEEFFQSLRVAILNSSIYFSEHPVFLKSLKELVSRLNSIFNIISPLKIGITPNSLIVGDNIFEKTAAYLELADFFHQRKIKSIEFKKGIDLKELAFFLVQLNMPSKDIIDKGGLGNILKRENLRCVCVESLDYSMFLKDEGQECKDIWICLFKEVTEKGDAREINDFVSNFETIIKKYHIEDFLENEDLKKNIYNFLAYLKREREDEFRKCSKQLLKFVLKNKDIKDNKRINELKMFFNILNDGDLSDTLWDEILTDENFNSFGFQLFSQFIDNNKHKNIADSLADRIKKEKIISPHTKGKIKDLFSVSLSPVILEIYKKTLDTIIEKADYKNGIIFDQKLLEENFYSTLLNLLAIETKAERISAIVEKILTNWSPMSKHYEPRDVINLFTILKKKVSDYPFLSPDINKIIGKITELVENMVVNGKYVTELDAIINFLDESVLGMDFYLNLFFNEKKLNPRTLQLFFKFYHNNPGLFYENIKANIADASFIKDAVSVLKEIKSHCSIDVLKYIFFLSNNFIKKEVLIAAGELFSHDIQDEEFLLAILMKENFFFKKKVLQIVNKNDELKKKAAEILLSVSGFWVSRNKLLEENINLIKIFKLREAQEYLVKISKLKFFWNWAVRTQAREILDEWVKGSSK